MPAFIRTIAFNPYNLDGNTIIIPCVSHESPGVQSG